MLTGIVSIERGNEIKEFLNSLLKNGEKVIELDLEHIEKFDISFIQLLVSFKKSCDDKGKKLVLMNYDEDFYKTVGFLELNEFFFDDNTHRGIIDE